MIGPAHAVEDLRAYLKGTWRLSRTISDFHGGKTAHYEGEARFAPDRSGLAYRESGKLMLEDAVFEAERTYHYRFPSLGCAAVVFDDERPFHSLDLTSGRWTTEHFCAPDRYEGAFCAESGAAWHSQWRIEGPRKDQKIETRYQRLPT